MVAIARKDQLRQELMHAGALGSPLGRLFFVDSARGSDGNPGVDRVYPLKTLTRAVALAEAGDTIVLAPGGSETVTASIAVAAAALRIVCPVANPAQGFTITGAGTLDLLTVSAANVHLEGLQFKRSAGAGSTTAGVLTTAAADGLTLRRCAFDYSDLTSSWTNYGLEITDDCNNVRVLDCLFADCHRGVLFATATAKDQIGSVVEGCEFKVGQATAWGIYSEPAGTGTVTDLRVSRCVFKEQDGDGTAATDTWDGTTGLDGASGPIWLDADVDRVLLEDCHAYTASAASFLALCAVDTGCALTAVGCTPELGTLTGEADIDVSEADYTAFVELLSFVPTAGRPCKDVVLDLDVNKTTTGFDTVATAADTLDTVAVVQTDGTNYRTAVNATQITANGDGTLEDSESGQRLAIGDCPAGLTTSIRVKVSAERGDAEIPYRITYRGAPPVVTAVAAA